MTRVFHSNRFNDYYDQNSGRTFSDLEFRKCVFVSCRLSMTRDPRRRSIVKNVKIIDCEQRGCALEAAIVEDVSVEGFKTNGLFQTWGSVFKHVALRGKIGRVMTSPLVATALAKPSEQNAFNLANANFYSTVDWALDIREAQFEEADLRGIPARLILRDTKTQFVITREKALQGRWMEVDLSGTHWKTAIELFLDTGANDKVLVAPRRHRRFQALLSGLWALRDAGILE